MRLATPACGWWSLLAPVDDGRATFQRQVRNPRMLTISCPLSSVQVTRRCSDVQCVATPRGGAEGIRTPDLRLAKAALSQLSYGPRTPGGPAWTRTRDLSLIRTAL